MKSDEKNLAGPYPYFTKLCRYSTKIYFNRNSYLEKIHYIDDDNQHDLIHHLDEIINLGKSKDIHHVHGILDEVNVIKFITLLP